MIQYALDSKNDRVHIDNAIKGEIYKCEICKSHLSPKQGKINRWHFAHDNKQDCDSWYEMTEWHRDWQREFSENCREIVINYGSEYHRADVKINDVVLEFQNSNMSIDEFQIRSEFYSKDNLLIWIINMRDRKRIPKWVDDNVLKITNTLIILDHGPCNLEVWMGDYVVNISDLKSFIIEFTKYSVITKSKYMRAEDEEIMTWIDRLRKKLFALEWGSRLKGEISHTIWRLEGEVHNVDYAGHLEYRLRKILIKGID